MNERRERKRFGQLEEENCSGDSVERCTGLLLLVLI